MPVLDMLAKGSVFEQLPDRPMAHCATLTVLPDGSLLTAWFGGDYETATDQVILASHRKSPEEGWSSPNVIAEMPGYALGQPVFLVRPDGELWLFFVVISNPGPLPSSTSFNMMPPIAAWTSVQPYRQRSFDGGQTWVSPEHLLDYPGLMFRSRPLLLPGRIIVPMYDENTWESRMLISDSGMESRPRPMPTVQRNVFRSRALRNTIKRILVLSIALAWMVPVLWMADTAFKPDSEIFTLPPRWIPSRFSLKHVQDVIYDWPFLR